MHRLLLNASISDDVSFGHSDRFIQDPNLEERIIKFRTSAVLGSIDQNEIENFFRGYNSLENIMPIRIVAEFLLEKFFEEVKRRGDFDDVRYIEDIPRTLRKNGNFLYEFINNGRTIKVYNCDKTQPVTEISRLIEIRKGAERHIILCDPRANRNPRTKFSGRIEAVKGLLDKKDYTLSYMLIYASDIFKKTVSRHLCMSRSYADPIEYLMRSPTNLSLVYSAGTTQLAAIGHKVVSRIQPTQDIAPSNQ